MNQLLAKAKALIAKLRKWVKDNFSHYEEEEIDNQPAPEPVPEAPVPAPGPKLLPNQMIFKGIRYTFELNFGNEKEEEKQKAIMSLLKIAVERCEDLLVAVSIVCLYYKLDQASFNVVAEDDMFDKVKVFVDFD